MTTKNILPRRAVAVVAVSYALPRRGLPAALSFHGWVDAALAGAGRRNCTELAIRLIGSAQGRELNRRYRGKDYATNVLSFPANPEPAPKMPLLGDLALCAPVVRREAREQGKRLRDHYAHLTIHGVLHLLGYDHANRVDAARMEALEIRILAGLGIPDPYA